MYSNNDDLRPVIAKVGLLLTELREIQAAGPRFRILHRFREPGKHCAPGEEVAAIFLNQRVPEIVLPLSPTSRMLFDLLARHTRIPQNASQIAAAMRADPFYRRHGANAFAQGNLAKTVQRTSVKEFVRRIRLALGVAFRDARLDIDPRAVLISESTCTNQVAYRLRARCEWAHLDHPGLRHQTIVSQGE